MVLKESPWKMGVWDDAQRVSEFRDLQTRYGGGMDEPIWRFRLPAVTTIPVVEKKIN
jgi:hypothetical protein